MRVLAALRVVQRVDARLAVRHCETRLAIVLAICLARHLGTTRGLQSRRTARATSPPRRPAPAAADGTTYRELRFLSVLTVTGVPLSEPARP